MAFELPLFTSAALAVLDRMPFDPVARSRFEVMSGGLVWPDETPIAGSAERNVLRPQGAIRCLIAYRRALTLGENRAEFQPFWEQVARHAPNWPGLRPERRGERAAHRLRAALRREKKCLAKLDAEMDADDAGTERNDSPPSNMAK